MKQIIKKFFIFFAIVLANKSNCMKKKTLVTIKDILTLEEIRNNSRKNNNQSLDNDNTKEIVSTKEEIISSLSKLFENSADFTEEQKLEAEKNLLNKDANSNIKKMIEEERRQNFINKQNEKTLQEINDQVEFNKKQELKGEFSKFSIKDYPF